MAVDLILDPLTVEVASPVDDLGSLTVAGFPYIQALDSVHIPQVEVLTPSVWDDTFIWDDSDTWEDFQT